MTNLGAAMQLDGAQTPGSSIAVAATTVRGSESFGMICSAFDLGWAEAADGKAVRLPQDMRLGTPLHSAAPEVSNELLKVLCLLQPLLCIAAAACKM